MTPDDSRTGLHSSKPTAAGIYDYLLNGRHYNAADKEAAEQALAIAPEARFAAIENRRFLGRAVEYLAKHGVRQYIDLGSGYPIGGQVHEIAERIVRDPRVVYVDYDPRVAEESRELLDGHGDVAIITQDIRRPWDIIDDPATANLIDWSQPVALIAAAILHFVKDEENPSEIIATFRDRMVSGSFLVLSHASGGENPEMVEDATKAWRGTKSGILLREPSEIEELFVGFELVPPGIVTTTEWGTTRPAPTDQGIILCGVGRVM